MCSKRGVNIHTKGMNFATQSQLCHLLVLSVSGSLDPAKPQFHRLQNSANDTYLEGVLSI